MGKEKEPRGDGRRCESWYYDMESVVPSPELIATPLYFCALLQHVL